MYTSLIVFADGFGEHRRGSGCLMWWGRGKADARFNDASDKNAT